MRSDAELFFDGDFRPAARRTSVYRTTPSVASGVTRRRLLSRQTFPALIDVNHYDTTFTLGLTAGQKSDLVTRPSERSTLARGAVRHCESK
jgi:hypothetical protein